MQEQAAPKMCQPVFLLESCFLSMLQSGEKRLWNSSIRLLPFCRLSLLPSARALVFGALRTSWKGTETITLAQMLMCGKVTNDNLIDSSHYFRNTDQYEKLMWGFSYISFCLSKHFWESDVFVSFLLTASL